jgi:hypothetical protein|tara:strand:+ start:2307 stop:2504 length:198 start_codon:yes stop_codon:yes gene_type:complete
MEMLAFVSAFGCGVVLGVYIMTQFEKRAERVRLQQLLELEDNITQLRELKDIYKNNQCTCKDKKK